ncbi:MAG: branched-chain amino acid ABC transporter permease [Chloroflexi bacterium]|nr:branched-chain amino acid ABC transporter permease [Chloroflexota bacterium]
MKKIISNWQASFVAAIVIFLAAYPLLGPSSYLKHLFILFFIWSVVAAYWNLLNGYVGINSLGNIGFLAIGGYTSGILALRFGLSPLITIPIGGVVTGLLVTLFLGFPALRLSGIYIALLTLIFADSLPSILTQTRDITGGGMGLHEIPPFFPGMEKVHTYYICFVFFLIAMLILYKVIHSKTGLAFVAMRDSENLANTLGINRYQERLKVFAISSFMTGIAGGFYVHSLGDISPTTLSIEPFLLALAMIELGGIGTFFGPILGAGVIVFGNEFLRLAGTLRLTLLGALICGVILFYPGGIMQLVEELGTRIKVLFNRKKVTE